MKTLSVDMETAEHEEQRAQPTEKTKLHVQWEESEWFKVWLKLAREEERTPAIAA